MKQKLLLLEDVDGLGRSGDIVSNAKPGFVRNYLFPTKKAIVASNQTIKMQERLKAEREKRASVDRKLSEELAAKLEECVISTVVKVDPEGNMYGSVTQLEIARLLQDKGYAVERRHITLPQALKTVGTHSVPLRLNEGVLASVKIEIIAEKTEQPNL